MQANYVKINENHSTEDGETMYQVIRGDLILRIYGVICEPEGLEVGETTYGIHVVYLTNSETGEQDKIKVLGFPDSKSAYKEIEKIYNQLITKK